MAVLSFYTMSAQKSSNKYKFSSESAAYYKKYAQNVTDVLDVCDGSGASDI